MSLEQLLLQADSILAIIIGKSFLTLGLRISLKLVCLLQLLSISILPFVIMHSDLLIMASASCDITLTLLVLNTAKG